MTHRTHPRTWEALNLPLVSRIIFYGCLAVNAVMWPLIGLDWIGWF